MWTRECDDYQNQHRITFRKEEGGKKGKIKIPSMEL